MELIPAALPVKSELSVDERRAIRAERGARADPTQKTQPASECLRLNRSASTPAMAEHRALVVAIGRRRRRRPKLCNGLPKLCGHRDVDRSQHDLELLE